MASRDPPNSRKYGVPIYGSSWVPDELLISGSDDQNPSDDGDSLSLANSSNRSYVVFAGGGGPGSNGIQNALLIARFDFASNSISDQPVMELGTGADLPYRMAVHPGGQGIICSFPKSCRWFEWDRNTSSGNQTLGIKPSEKELEQLEDVGQQLALTFNMDASLLAVGAGDGYLRVFKWPSMEIVLSDEHAHASVKDLDFSQDGKYLVSTGSGDPCKVWDMASPGVVTSLMKENDELFGFCRFSQKSDGSQILYTTMHGKSGSIVQWNVTTWRRINTNRIVRDTICAFNISNDGKLLAIGTDSGDILVINSSTMRVQMTIRKAHLGFVTTLAFSSDSRALISASMDSSLRVTLIKDKTKEGFNYYWIAILIMLISVFVYFMKA